MHLHEYQTKEVLQKYAIPVPEWTVAAKIEEVEKFIESHDFNQAIVKIQVHAGGRGKAGGVKFAKTKDEIISYAQELIGFKLVNNQTGKEGLISEKVLISKPASIKKEYYLGIIMDRATSKAVMIASPEGGMEIEEVAAKHPDKILKLPLSLNGTLKKYQLLTLTNFMGWKEKLADQGADIAFNLAKMFTEKDATLLEINPLVLTEENQLFAIDAKLTIDDNALFRQPDLAYYFDPSQVSKSEVSAKEFDLAYIAMEGDIGCMVNGAGLAMATMDIIQLHGSKPANFLDVGGGASKEKVAAGFRIILSDPNVKAVLVNIFGGIMNCEVLAEGILQAAKELKIHVPLVVRMEGTNVEQGKKMLLESNLPIETAKDLNEAAMKAVAAAKKGL
ncbi:MAG: ADP-forming succinate--CoA ligase subunit beta [Chlamydiae bacterium CG10_big_fil_rev_8_21_14_0_10_35_9]|nr:MAG: ADP-forming succinate--CoA ligase subunit beta [Chlamydiae bacterium CG10_big_fil_rev_8_21_14_0_10_35_9]